MPNQSSLQLESMHATKRVSFAERQIIVAKTFFKQIIVSALRFVLHSYEALGSFTIPQGLGFVLHSCDVKTLG